MKRKKNGIAMLALDTYFGREEKEDKHEGADKSESRKN